MEGQWAVNISAVLSCLVLAVGIASASEITYSLTVSPRRALLGQEITATLACTNDTDVPRRAVTLSHASLTLAVRVVPESEPLYSFPNRRVIGDGALVIHETSSDGWEVLRSGERRARSFELTALFPQQLLNVGQFEVFYTVYDGSREIRSPVVRLNIESSPESVDHLLIRLQDPDLAVRNRAAFLLHRITAQGLDFDAAAGPAEREQVQRAWEDWWHTYGSHMKWNPTSGGVATRTSVKPHAQVGSVIYPRRELSSESRAAWNSALRDWLHSPSLKALRCSKLVADQEFSYPVGNLLVLPDPEMLQSLMRALSAVPNAPNGPEAAVVLLSTIARMPDPSLRDAVEKLRANIPNSSSWDRSRALTAGLLDLLTPPS